MAVAVELRFPAGRYHATAWGHHVNEGRLDWPPSPWRILRALVATWHNRAPEIPREALAELVSKLSAPPAYAVPACVGHGHTRHYMPKGSLRADDRDMVFDAFVALDPEEPLVVQWDADLSPEERKTLALLLQRLTYMGRAESWCRARLGDPTQRAVAAETSPGNGSQADLVKLLALEPDAGLAELEQDTWTLRRAGANRPRGTRLIRWWVPRPDQRAARRPRPPLTPRPVLALLQIEGRPLPLRTSGVDVALLVRGCVRREVRRELERRGEPDDASRLSGVYYLPDRAEGDERRIGACWVYDPGGLSPEVCAALGRLRELTSHRHDLALRAALAGLGAPAAFRGAGLLGPSRVWRTWTPALLRPAGGAEPGWPDEAAVRERVVRDLGSRLADQRSTRIVPPVRPCGFQASGKRVRGVAYRRWGLGAHHLSACAPVGFEVTFSEEVSGPLLVGEGAHLGFGLLVPGEEQVP